MGARSLKVLLIEDDEGCAEVMGACLRTLECEVWVAATREEALGLATRERPDLILLDLNLESGRWSGEPRGGTDVFLALRAAPETAGIPVVIHSAYARFAAEAPRWMPRSDGFLPKPFKRADLRALLGRFRGPDARVG